MSESLHETTDPNEESDVKRTVEVIGERLRRCKKCKVVVEGELRDFRFDEVRRAYYACGWQLPPGWSYYTYFKADGSGPWQVHICPACTVEVKAFVDADSH